MCGGATIMFCWAMREATWRMMSVGSFSARRLLNGRAARGFSLKRVEVREEVPRAASAGERSSSSALLFLEWRSERAAEGLGEGPEREGVRLGVSSRSAASACAFSTSILP
eukprot:7903795-Pyramimonas_sp.AAC.2